MTSTHRSWTPLSMVSPVGRSTGPWFATAAAIVLAGFVLLGLWSSHAAAMLRLNDALDDQDDVQNVWSNFEIDDAELEGLE